MIHKKWWIWLVLVLAGLVLAVAAAQKWMVSAAGTVEVTPVATLNQGSWITDMGNMEGVSGTIVSDVSQDVTVPDGKVVSKVYVEEGDTVKIGDKLLSYDTTLLELDKELQEIELQVKELEMKSANADLEKLQKMVPSAQSGQGGEGVELFQYEYQEIGNGEAGLELNTGTLHLSEGELSASMGGEQQENQSARELTSDLLEDAGTVVSTAEGAVEAGNGGRSAETVLDEIVTDPEGGSISDGLIETEAAPADGAQESGSGSEAGGAAGAGSGSETGGAAGAGSGSETGGTAGTGSGSETGGAAETESETSGAAESESELESETEGDELIEDQDTEEAGEDDILIDDESKEPAVIRLHIWWNHKDQPKQDWPKQVTLRFYEKKEDDEPAFTKQIEKPGLPEQKESEALISEPYETGQVSELSQQSESGQESGIRPQLETGQVSELGQQSESRPEAETEPDADAQSPLEEWNGLSFVWPQERSAPGSYTLSIFVENYIPMIQWDPDTRIYRIKMNYLKPEENLVGKLDPLSYLDAQTGIEGRYYKGTGTKEHPFVFFCTEGAIIRSSFINWVFGFEADGRTRIKNADGTPREGYHILLELREEDSIGGAFIRTIGLDGTRQPEQGWEPKVYWIFTSEAGMVRHEEETGEEEPEGGDSQEPDWNDSEGYTASELTLMVASKKLELRKLVTDEKEARLKLKEYEKELDRATVCSAVNGYVASVGSSDENSDAYMVLKNKDGFYLKTTVSELDLETVQKGMQIQCSSWMTGERFQATVTEVTYYPAAESSDSYGTNSNASRYPVLAVIDGYDSTEEMMDVNVTYPMAASTASDAIYLQRAYIRTENGRSFVYKAGTDGKLVKQYIKTGDNISGSIEVKQGLTLEDQITFPYAQNAKEGADTKTADDLMEE